MHDVIFYGHYINITQFTIFIYLGESKDLLGHHKKEREWWAAKRMDFIL
jgi:hypothetical protein